MGLADRFYRTRIIKEIPGTLSEKAAPPSIDPFPMHFRTAKELWMSLGLAEGRPERLNTDRRSLLTWIRSCQNPDGGFGFLPGTTSYMENVHTCLRVLALLNAAPLDHARARQFILNAWTRSGGFARKSGGAPFLDATWHAVGSLSILEKARKRL
jgi:prenyltransferase beta subunit